MEITKFTAVFVLLVTVFSMSMGQSFINCGSKDSDQIKNDFSKFDSDGDNSLTTSELATFMRSRGQYPTEATLQHLITAFGSDDNETMNLSEFTKMMKNGTVLNDVCSFTSPSDGTSITIVSKGSYSYVDPDTLRESFKRNLLHKFPITFLQKNISEWRPNTT